MTLPKPVENWARKTDAAEGAWARDAVDSWARDFEFSRPFSRGEAEAAAGARTAPHRLARIRRERLRPLPIATEIEEV
ncbi:hypothetical protein [Glycomyces algeriensis]|uniref:Uncharacterized protein n=1 Tax=Glycomyces algeriensis TaxID=256037 RepID=A0A9W6LHJ1_9ACTN|nr:hypothetical protein [Glycomyces algeriensis]MDA1365679.1 hypothetical protein [Glycomyces algeriensis]MDR7351367.1 hypothetical protein [Glycomyces algeriensis]GLI44082.1 hypothetical protein GALLR39Z86_39320 [Glycomyces algeriensis]